MKSHPIPPRSPAGIRFLHSRILGLALGCVATAAFAQPSGPAFTEVKPYAVSVAPQYTIQPLLTVGDHVPNTSAPQRVYQMVGLPDGLGATKGHGNLTLLYMNHELEKDVLSEPNVGEALNRGAFVSRWTLNKVGHVISGERAYDNVHDAENGLVLPAADTTNLTPSFSRFCSGSLAFREAGFDRATYFAGEESSGAATFDGKGGLACAIFGSELHTLVKLGRMRWENALVRPHVATATVIMCMEDAGTETPDSQLYMYVGDKNRGAGASALTRNGLDTGTLYTFVAGPQGNPPADETGFTSGSITGTWVALPDQTNRSDVQLEADADAVGAFGFIRIEDGAWSKTDRNTFYFVTTGTGAGNALGRTYEVTFNPANILGTTKITMIYNADEIAADGGDIAFAPDNVDTSARRFLMIQEDGTEESRPEYATRARDGSIWRLDLLNNFAAKRVAELNPPGTAFAAGETVPPPVPPGFWESTGIIDAAGHFGHNSWIFNVQAHAPSLPPAPNTVEDGQLLIMLPTGVNLGFPGKGNFR